LHQKRATATGGSFDSATSCLWQDSEAVPVSGAASLIQILKWIRN